MTSHEKVAFSSKGDGPCEFHHGISRPPGRRDLRKFTQHIEVEIFFDGQVVSANGELLVLKGPRVFSWGTLRIPREDKGTLGKIGCLGYIGGYTTQLCGDTTSIVESKRVFFVAQLLVWGPVVWIPGIPENERDWQPWVGAPIRIPNHRAPNQQLTIS